MQKTTLSGLSLAVELDRLAWRGTRVPGVSWLPLHVVEKGTRDDRKRGASAVLIRMEPGRGYEPHRHIGFEEVLVLAGGYRDELGTYRAGDHVHYDDGSHHAPVALGDAAVPTSPENPACVLYAVTGGIELDRE